jgi:hypothetical protein
MLDLRTHEEVVMVQIETPARTDGAASSALAAGAVDHAAAVTAQVHALCTELDALDTEIAALTPQVAELPAVLAALAGHPALWLLLGREGVDRPGGLGTVVGQQVVTVTRIDRRALIVIGAVMLLVGLAVGAGIGMWYGGV